MGFLVDLWGDVAADVEMVTELATVWNCKGTSEWSKGRASETDAVAAAKEDEEASEAAERERCLVGVTAVTAL